MGGEETNHLFTHFFLGTGVSQLEILQVYQLLFFIVVISIFPGRKVQNPTAPE
jgi:hypothetical protein